MTREDRIAWDDLVESSKLRANISFVFGAELAILAKDSEAREMLVICKSLFAAVCFGEHGHVVDGPYICVGKPYVDAIRDAIAKAEGR